uniref:Uncharacterized protein n=1 Tax=Arundo donax TaxID=35708 RepID=A0A0A9HID3_ARUDO
MRGSLTSSRGLGLELTRTLST